MLDNSKYISDTELQEVNGGASGYNGPCFVYMVKHGDCLSALAKKFRTTVIVIMAINGLTNPNLYVGQKLLIPYLA